MIPARIEMAYVRLTGAQPNGAARGREGLTQRVEFDGIAPCATGAVGLDVVDSEGCGARCVQRGESMLVVPADWVRSVRDWHRPG